MNDHSIMTIEDTISGLEKLASEGPPSMGSGLGGGSQTELDNERRWITRLADGIRNARRRTNEADHINRLETAGARWEIAVPLPLY